MGKHTALCPFMCLPHRAKQGISQYHRSAPQAGRPPAPPTRGRHWLDRAGTSSKQATVLAQKGQSHLAQASGSPQQQIVHAQANFHGCQPIPPITMFTQKWSQPALQMVPQLAALCSLRANLTTTYPNKGKGSSRLSDTMCGAYVCCFCFCVASAIIRSSSPLPPTASSSCTHHTPPMVAPHYARHTQSSPYY